LGFFGVLVGSPRRSTEEGGQLVCTLCVLGDYLIWLTSLLCERVGLCPNGRGGLTKNNQRGGVLRGNHERQGDLY
jgi:hypothetical protein